MPDKDNLDTSLEGSNVGGGVSRQCDVSVIVGEPENTIRDLEADIAHWRAEIERLRAEVDRVRADAERLRAALREMVDLCDKGFFEEVGSPDFTGPALEEACAALERKP